MQGFKGHMPGQQGSCGDSRPGCPAGAKLGGPSTAHALTGTAPTLSNHPSNSPQRQLTLHPMPLFPIANLLLQRRQQIKRNIRRLKILRIRMRHIMRQRSKCRSPRRRRDLSSRKPAQPRASPPAARSQSTPRIPQPRKSAPQKTPADAPSSAASRATASAN